MECELFLVSIQVSGLGLICLRSLVECENIGDFVLAHVLNLNAVKLNHRLIIDEMQVVSLAVVPCYHTVSSILVTLTLYL